MPPRLEAAPKKRVRRKAAPKSVPRDAIYQRPKPKVVRPVPRRSIGQNAPPAPKVLQRPKHKVISDVSSTGGYDTQRAVQFRREARKATGQAHKGKPFDPYYLRGAINTGIAPDVHEGKAGVFFVHKKRRLLPDTDVPIQPKTGTVKKLTKRNIGALETNELTTSAVRAPAIKVLNAVSAPSHAIAGAALGKSLGYGLRHHTTFKDVLEKHGVKGPLGAVGGFVGDVVADPVTYLTFGTGGVGAKAAEQAARKATEDALAQGVTKKVADRAGRAAARVALDKKGGRGIQAGMRFHVPLTDATYHPKTSGRASAAVGRKLRPMTSKVRESGPVQTLGRSFVHDFRPKEHTPQQHATIREAEREHRARVQTGSRKIVRRTQAVARHAKDAETQHAVQDVIEQAPRDVPQHLADLEARKVAIKEQRVARKARAAGDSPELVAAQREQRAATKEAARRRRVRRVDPTKSPGELSARDTVKMRRVQAGLAIAGQDLRAARREAKSLSPHEQRLATNRGTDVSDFGRLERQEAEHAQAMENHRDRAAAAREVGNEPRARYHERQAKKHDQRLDDIGGQLERLTQMMDPGPAMNRVQDVLGRLRDARGRVGKYSEAVGRIEKRRVAGKPGPRKVKPRPIIRTAQSQTSAAPRVVLRPSPVGRQLVSDIQTRAVRGGVHASGERVHAAQQELDNNVINAVRKGQTVDEALRHNRIGPQDVSPDVLKVVSHVQRDFEKDRKARVAAGLEQPHEKFNPQGPEDAQAYFRHTRSEDLEPPKGKDSTLRSTAKVPTRKGRIIRKPLRVTEYETPGYHSRDLPTVYASDRLRTVRDVSLSKMWQKVASTGKPLHRQAEIGAEDMVYKVTPHGLTPLSKEGGAKVDPDKVNAALRDRGGKYVILHRRTVKDVEDRLAGSSNVEPLTRAFDKAQGQAKLLYTQPNPSYHLRNLAGDSFNAFEGDASAKSFIDAFRTLRTMAARNKVEGSSLDEHAAALNTPINLGKAGTTTLGKELHHAEEHGAIGTGFAGTELNDLLRGQSKLAKIGQYREDFARLATYLSARKRGMTPTQAADWSLQHHFDYADLTRIERGARRVIPFWTFFARNTRLQATKVVTRPGKHATLAKLLNDSAQAAGFNSYSEYTDNLKNYQQRGLPIPVPFGGNVYTVQIGLPATDLNQVTTSYTQFAQDIANRVTFFKTFAEVPLNYSTFFQQNISPEGNELTKAPPSIAAVVAQVPPLKKLLGVQKVDGEWMWTRKADYVARSLPEGNLATSLFGGENPLRQQTRGQTIAGWATGAKIQTFGTPQQRYQQVNQQLHDARIQEERMRNRGQALNPDQTAKPAYRKQLDLVKQLTKTRDKMSKDLGLPQRKRLKRARKPRSSFGSGLGGGGVGGEGLGGGLSD